MTEHESVENPGPLPIMATNAVNVRAAKDVSTSYLKVESGR